MNKLNKLEWLLVSLANNMGFKGSFDERVEYARELMNSYNGGLEGLRAYLAPLCGDELELSIADAWAYLQAASGVETGHLVFLDASNSGTQIMSALTNDVNGLALTGLMPSDKPADSYTSLFKSFMANAGEVDLTRNQIKKVIMPYFYGSEACLSALPAGSEDLFCKTMKQEVNGAYRLRNFLTSYAKVGMGEFSWQLPDLHWANVLVTKQVREEFTFRGETVERVREVESVSDSKYIKMAANAIHSVDAYVMRELTSRAGIDRALVENALKARVLGGKTVNSRITEFAAAWEATGMATVRTFNYLQSQEDWEALSDEHQRALVDLAKKLLDMPRFAVVGIHDAFGALPEFCNYSCELYRDLIAELVDGTLLDSIIGSTCSKQFLYRKVEGLSDLVRKSTYGIH